MLSPHCWFLLAQAYLFWLLFWGVCALVCGGVNDGRNVATCADVCVTFPKSRVSLERGGSLR